MKITICGTDYDFPNEPVFVLKSRGTPSLGYVAEIPAWIDLRKPRHSKANGPGLLIRRDIKRFDREMFKHLPRVSEKDAFNICATILSVDEIVDLVKSGKVHEKAIEQVVGMLL